MGYQYSNHYKNSDQINHTRSDKRRDDSKVPEHPVLQRNFGNQNVLRALKSGQVRVSQPSDAGEQSAERTAIDVMRRQGPTPGRNAYDRTAPNDPTTSGVSTKGGHALSKSVRGYFEPRFGRDFSNVRVHTDDAAAESARSLGARAYTVQNDIVFGAQQFAPESHAGKHLLAHELSHTLQRPPVANRIIHRYGTGEHTQFGKVDSMIVPDHLPYTVLPGEGLIVIARKFGVDVNELRDLNLDKLHDFQIRGRRVTGFFRDEVILIPSKDVRVNAQPLGATAAATSAAATATGAAVAGSAGVVGPAVAPTTHAAVTTATAPTGQQPIEIQGETFTYGQIIAIADFFDNPEQLFLAPVSELRAIQVLLIREEATPGSVTTAEWETATHGRYLRLAQANDAHFGPQNSSFIAASTAGASSDNHRDMWEQHHMTALDLMLRGQREEALATNAFADHFLTDAFAAGHLFNKQDAMAMAQGSITGNEDAVFDQIAAIAWANPAVSTLCSRYESTAWHHRNIETEGVFATLLKGVYDDAVIGRPLILNAYAKVSHDDLNSRMVEVENLAGDHWTLSGDDSLNADSLAVGRKAVAQSQVNVLNMANDMGPINYTQKFDAVWQYAPYPTTAGETFMRSRLNATANAMHPDSINAMAALIESEISTIISGLVAAGELQLN